MTNLLPEYLPHRKDMLAQKHEAPPKLNQNKYKQASTPSIEVVTEILAQTHEIEFYDYATKLFWEKINCLRNRAEARRQAPAQDGPGAANSAADPRADSDPGRQMARFNAALRGYAIAPYKWPLYAVSWAYEWLAFDQQLAMDQDIFSLNPKTGVLTVLKAGEVKVS